MEFVLAQARNSVARHCGGRTLTLLGASSYQRWLALVVLIQAASELAYLPALIILSPVEEVRLPIHV